MNKFGIFQHFVFFLLNNAYTATDASDYMMTDAKLAGGVDVAV